jgi:hypothetical protein
LPGGISSSHWIKWPFHGARCSDAYGRFAYGRQRCRFAPETFAGYISTAKLKFINRLAGGEDPSASPFLCPGSISSPLPQPGYVCQALTSLRILSKGRFWNRYHYTNVTAWISTSNSGGCREDRPQKPWKRCSQPKRTHNATCVILTGTGTQGRPF